MALSRFAFLLLPVSTVIQAQNLTNTPPVRNFTDTEILAIEMPVLAFDMTDKVSGDFDKYFYYHRPDTQFAVAFADISECDALSSGMSYYAGANQSAISSAVAQYGLAGAAGGAIGSFMADAIFGSAERRKMRRMNIRNCMFYKGYDRYGLQKDLWQEFNFEEGFSKENAEKREAALLKQARVASGAKPAQEVLEP